MARKFMRRIAASILVPCVALSLLAGCNGKENAGKENASTVQPQATKMTTIKVWTNSGHTKAFLEKKIADFNSKEGKEKGINIEYSVYADNYKNVIEMAQVSGQSPELFAINGGLTLVNMVSKGWVLPLEEMPGGPELLKKYPKDFFTEGQTNYKGKTYNIPFSISTFKLIYNKDLFKKAGIVDEKGAAKPPKTWAEVVDYARIITKQGGGKEYGIAFGMKQPSFWRQEILHAFAPSVGKLFFDPKKGEFDFTPFKVAFTEYLFKIRADKSFLPGPEMLNNDTVRAQFAEGNVGMKMSGSWDVGVLKDQFPAKCDWDAAEIPVLDLKSINRSPVTPSAGLVSVSSSAKNSDPAKVMEVFKLFNNDDILIGLYENGLSIPYSDSLIKKAKEPDASIKGWKSFSKMENTFALPILPESVKPEGDDYNNAFIKVWLNAADLDKTLADLNKRYNEKFKKDVTDGKLDMKDYLNNDFNMNMK